MQQQLQLLLPPLLLHRTQLPKRWLVLGRLGMGEVGRVGWRGSAPAAHPSGSAPGPPRSTVLAWAVMWRQDMRQRLPQRVRVHRRGRRSHTPTRHSSPVAESHLCVIIGAEHTAWYHRHLAALRVRRSPGKLATDPHNCPFMRSPLALALQQPSPCCIHSYGTSPTHLFPQPTSYFPSLYPRPQKHPPAPSPHLPSTQARPPAPGAAGP